MTNYLVLTASEVLLILIFRSELKGPEAAAALGLNDHTYLSKLLSGKKPMPEYVIQNACKYFNVSRNLFDGVTIEFLTSRLNALEERVKILELEKMQMSASLALAHARLEECERQKNILESRKN